MTVITDTVMSPKIFALLVLACLVDDAFYTDAAPTTDLTASDTEQYDNRVLDATVSDYENEVDDKDKTTFENFIQGIHNIDAAMEAMIDNYTDGVESLGEENTPNSSILDPIADKKPSYDRSDAIEIESPLTNVPTMGDDLQATTGEPAVPGAEQQDGQAKGPFSGLMPGGGTTAAPESGSPLPGGLLGGGALPSGFPGLPGGLSGAGGDGQSPTLILGGFSVLVMPLRGMSLSNIASMMSGGQQIMQLLPKPGVG